MERTCSDGSCRCGAKQSFSWGTVLHPARRSLRVDVSPRIRDTHPIVATVTIYTDGACSGNPGPGGWGAILISGSLRKEISGGDPSTTNNRMELIAAIRALRELKGPSDVDLHTDSKYVKQGITEWIIQWKANGWKRRSGKRLLPVKNEDLWKELDVLVRNHRVTFHWVEGHAGHPENERADALARGAIPRT